MIPVECYFALSALLFFIGVYGFVTRRNLIAMLISVELVLNAVDINFAAINRLLYPNGMEGMFMTLFVIGVAAAESAVAIAIIINVYRKFKSDSVEHQLHRDEHGNQVTTGDKTIDTDEEQECAQHEITFYWNHTSFSSFLATTKPPMIHASRNTEMNSKGNTY